MLILKIEESLENSLDILDENYNAINKILKKPIFFDSIEIRQVVASLKECHNAILLIANNLTNDIGIIGETNNQENQEEKSK